jgi:EmrB/QacA subfamily drug resistance transporter
VSHPSIEASYRRRWLILAVLCLSLVMIVMGNISLNIAIPTLTDDLHANFSELQWMVDAYSLLFAGLLLPAGALADRFGRKGALQGGLAVFGLGSLYASFASHPWQIIAARGLMGVAAAFVMPGTLSILASVFPPRERPQAIALWAGVAGASVTVGMLWSGVLLDNFWWGSVFLTNVPIVLVALALGYFLLPTSRDPNQAPLDRPGALLSVAALSAFLYGVIEAPEIGWADTKTVVALVLSAILVVAFIWWERRAPEPMLNLSYFSDRRFTIGCVSISTAFFALFGCYFLLTQYLQLVKGFDPLVAGLYALSAGVTSMVFSPLSARLVQRAGYRPVLVSGLLSVAAGMATLAYLSLTSPGWVVVLGMGLLGIGVGLCTPPSTAAIIQSLPLGKAGVGSAVNDTTRELGGAIGIAVLGSLLASRFRSTVAPAVHGLPASAADAVRHGVGPALQAAADPRVQRLSPTLADTSRHAFTSGILVAMWAAAALAIVGALVVYRTMPAGMRPAGTTGPEPVEAYAMPNPDGARAVDEPAPTSRADDTSSLDDPTGGRSG